MEAVKVKRPYKQGWKRIATVARRRKKRLEAQKEAIKTFSRHKKDCSVCKDPAVEEIKKAYMLWFRPHEIGEEFDIRPRDVTGHASWAGWDIERTEDMDPLAIRLMNVLADNLNLDEVQPKEALDMIAKLSRHRDRKQGKIIDYHKIDHNKNVTFVAVPLPGGSLPLVPESKQKVLASGIVIEAKWEANEEKEAAEGPGTGELPAGTGASTDVRGPPDEPQDGE